MGEYFENRLKTKVWVITMAFLTLHEEEIRAIIHQDNPNINIKSILPIRKMGFVTEDWRVLSVGPGTISQTIIWGGIESFVKKIPKGHKAKVSNKHEKLAQGAEGPSIAKDTSAGRSPSKTGQDHFGNQGVGQKSFNKA